MRLIDEDNVIFEFNRMLDIADERNARPDQKEEFKTIRTYIEWARYVVECAPIIDAVDRELYEQCKFDKDIAEEQLKKIVRCRDCKRCNIQSWHEIDRKVTLYYCKEYKVYKDSDDYCSYGERKEEE